MLAERERVEQVALSYRVDGHLSENEISAVDRLVRRAQTLANGLFRGDLEGALRSLGGVELEASPIASFSIDLDGSLEAELVVA